MRLLHSYSNTLAGKDGPRELIAEAIRVQRQSSATAGRSASAWQLRQHEVDRLVTRYFEVRNIRQVAREWRISRTTVAKHLAERGIETSHRMREAHIAEAVRLYADGWSSIRIGQYLGFDNHTVLAALRRAGIIIRPPVTARVGDNI